MSAAVFDEHGRTQMNLSIQPQREMTVKEIERAGRRLLKGCARITAAVGGRPPGPRA
jgi:DNA-binding IclR family transcriptional regulator